MLTMITMIMMNMWYKAVHWKPVNEVMLLERVQHNGYSSAEQARQSRLGKSVHGGKIFKVEMIVKVEMVIIGGCDGIEDEIFS